MVKKNLLQHKIGNSISQKDQRIEKERPFHLLVNIDHYGMIKDIEGWMHIDEAEVLWQTIQNKTNCLELGTYKGLSTWIISHANLTARITTVDVFETLTNQAKQNCSNFKNISFVTADSNTWLKNCHEKYDWVFVDHSHEKDYMDVTIDLLKMCVSKNHIILLHDIHLPGVRSQLKKFSKYTTHRNLGIGQFW